MRRTKLAFKRFHGGPVGSGAPQAKVNMQDPKKLNKDPMQAPTGVGASQELQAPQGDNKYVARGLGSYNRVMKKAPAPAPTGKLVTASVHSLNKVAFSPLKTGAHFGQRIGNYLSSKFLFPRLRKKLDALSPNKRTLALLTAGLGAAGVTAGGLYMMHKGRKQMEAKKKEKEKND